MQTKYNNVRNLSKESMYFKPIGLLKYKIFLNILKIYKLYLMTNNLQYDIIIS